MSPFLTNWRTTAAGSLSILLGLSGLLGLSVGAPVPAEVSIGLIVSGITGILAKDGHA